MLINKWLPVVMLAQGFYLVLPPGPPWIALPWVFLPRVAGAQRGLLYPLGRGGAGSLDLGVS